MRDIEPFKKEVMDFWRDRHTFHGWDLVIVTLFVCFFTAIVAVVFLCDRAGMLSPPQNDE